MTTHFVWKQQRRSARFQRVPRSLISIRTNEATRWKRAERLPLYSTRKQKFSTQALPLPSRTTINNR